MRSISQAFRQQYIKGNRNYLITIHMTLADDTDLTITEQDIWQGGFSFEEGISSTDTFDVGSAIVGKCSFVLDNIDERYSQYDFYNATCWIYLNLVGLEEDNPVRLGYYTVDETTYNGSLITLNCLDNMWRFDVPFDVISGVTYPTTARTLINAICGYSGINVTLTTQSFHGYTHTIASAPTDVNCREVLQYIAQMCCCYCKIDNEGNLGLYWIDKTDITGITDYDGGTYNTDTTPYSDGCDLDGGEFNPWNTGDVADGGAFYDPYDNMGYITSNSTMTVGTDDIWITGCRVCTNDPEAEDGYDYLYVDTNLEQDHERYILVIQDNPLITPDNASTIATDVGTILAGTPIRTFSSSSLSDLSIESGDPVEIHDFRGNRYRTWVTNLKFVSDGYESFSCGAESPMTNKVVRYSENVKTLVEAKKKTQEILSAYDQAVKNMNELASQAFGYHEYTYTVGSSKVMWRYSGNDIDTSISPSTPSNPRFPDSDVVWKITVDGVFISTEKDEDGFQIFTNGYDANTGTALLNMMYVIGLNADWINAGHITAENIDTTNLIAENISAQVVSSKKFQSQNGNSYIDFTNENTAHFNFGGRIYTSNSEGRLYAVRLEARDSIMLEDSNGNVKFSVDASGNVICRRLTQTNP